MNNPTQKSNFMAGVSVVLQPAHLRRTLIISLLVGIWLTLLNVGEQLLADGLSLVIVGKFLLNFLTPFAVANAGLLSHVNSDPDS